MTRSLEIISTDRIYTHILAMAEHIVRNDNDQSILNAPNFTLTKDVKGYILNEFNHLNTTISLEDLTNMTVLFAKILSNLKKPNNTNPNIKTQDTQNKVIMLSLLSRDFESLKQQIIEPTFKVKKFCTFFEAIYLLLNSSIPINAFYNKEVNTGMDLLLYLLSEHNNNPTVTEQIISQSTSATTEKDLKAKLAQLQKKLELRAPSSDRPAEDSNPDSVGDTLETEGPSSPDDKPEIGGGSYPDDASETDGPSSTGGASETEEPPPESETERTSSSDDESDIKGRSSSGDAASSFPFRDNIRLPLGSAFEEDSAQQVAQWLHEPTPTVTDANAAWDFLVHPELDFLAKNDIPTCIQHVQTALRFLFACNRGGIVIGDQKNTIKKKDLIEWTKHQYDLIINLILSENIINKPSKRFY